MGRRLGFAGRWARRLQHDDAVAHLGTDDCCGRHEVGSWEWRAIGTAQDCVPGCEDRTRVECLGQGQHPANLTIHRLDGRCSVAQHICHLIGNVTRSAVE
jgi:hypothetical protein